MRGRLLMMLFCCSVVLWLFFFFFFQAEDGIRDHCVTGVQTCALPIFAALLDLVAVTVEDPVEDGGALAPRALQHQRLVEADAGAALPEPAQQPRSEQGLIGGRIEDDEIVADPVHLGEIDAHCGQSIAETPGEWTPRGERPWRCEPVCPVEWLAVVRANGAGCRGNARGAPSPQTGYRFDDYFRRARRAIPAAIRPTQTAQISLSRGINRNGDRSARTTSAGSTVRAGASILTIHAPWKSVSAAPTATASAAGTAPPALATVGQHA